MLLNLFLYYNLICMFGKIYNKQMVGLVFHFNFFCENDDVLFCFIAICYIIVHNRFWQSLISLKGNRIPFFVNLFVYPFLSLIYKIIVIYITFYVISFIKSILKMAVNTTTLYACDILFCLYSNPRNFTPTGNINIWGNIFYVLKIFHS